MVDKARLFERLMATFIDELGDHVRTINNDVMTLEDNPTPEDREAAIVRLFRAAHSLKGAARAVEQQSIEQLCHQLEDVFTRLQTGTITPSTDLFSLMLSVTDAIESAGMQLREGNVVEQDSLNLLIADLKQAAVGTYKAPRGTPAKSTAKPATAKPTTVEDQETSKTGVKPPPREVKEPAGSPTVGENQPRERRELTGTVRVGEDKLDSLLAQAGELLVARQRVEGRPNDLDGLTELLSVWKAEWQTIERTVRSLVERDGNDPLMARSTSLTARVAEVVARNGHNLRLCEKRLDQFRRELISDARQLGHASRALQDEVHRIRMFPLGEACAGLRRTVRDLADSTGKSVELTIEGGEIEMDRSVLERLSDPLKHLVRNAVDHGIELPDERRAAGKSVPGTISIAASLRGTHVDILIADDGAGMNPDRIRRKLRERNRPVPDDEQELIRCALLPGFSTAETITNVSGRGVGLDVVKSQVESLHGSIDITTQAGFGTRFLLSVPLTLTTLSALFVRVGRHPMAIPSRHVRKLVRFRPDEMNVVNGRNVLPLGDAPIPVASLERTLGLANSNPTPHRGRMLGVIIQSAGRQTVFLVDDVLYEGEAVIKNLGPRIHRPRFVSGGVLMQSGSVALVLNAAAVIQAASGNTSIESITSDLDIRDMTPKRHTVLVVDDSMTTRTLLKSILDAAGHDVAAAVDGQDAWDRMQVEDFELVVADVDMPHMNGFELTRNIRASDRLSRTPVVLMTSRDTEEDKAHGLQAGANAYMIKSAFDQTNILQTIDQLL